MKRISILLFVFCTSFASAAWPQARPQFGYEVMVSDVPEARAYQDTTPHCINPAGEVVGWCAGSNNVAHGFMPSSDASVTAFGPPNSAGTIVYGNNSTGWVTGSYVDAQGVNHGFLRDPGRNFTTFSALDAGAGCGKVTYGYTINAAREIVGWAGPGQITESSSAERVYGLVKEVIGGAVEWGLEESGTRLLGPSGWKLFKAVINPGLTMLRNNFPQLFGTQYWGTSAAQGAVNQALRWVDTDPTFRDAVLQKLNTLDQNQRQQLAILIETRDLSRKSFENTKEILRTVAKLSQQMAHVESELQHTPTYAEQDWYDKAGRSKNPSERISLYTAAIEHNQNTVMAYFQRGWIYFTQEDFNSAFFDFNRAVQLNPAFAAALTNRGASSQNLGRIDAAITDYTASSKLNPAEVTNYENLGRIYFDRRDYPGAYAMAKLQLQYSSDSKERYDHYVRLSWYALFNRDFAGAIAYANKGIEIDPANIYIYTNLAHGFLFTNQLKPAWEIYTKYTGIKLSSGAYWDEALLKDFQDLENAGIVHPQMKALKVTLRGNLSYALLFERRFDQAAAYAKQAITLDPDAIWVYANLAHSLLLRGRRDEAIAIYIRYKGRYLEPLGRTWEASINEDFDELSKYGISHPDIQSVRALLTTQN